VASRIPLVQIDSPTVGVLDYARLDARQRLVELIADGALIALELVRLALVRNLVTKKNHKYVYAVRPVS
jgi:hypothetical protein